MTDEELKRSKELFPNLEKEAAKNLEIMLLEIRNRDWSMIGEVMLLKHDYIQKLLLDRKEK